MIGSGGPVHGSAATRVVAVAGDGFLVLSENSRFRFELAAVRLSLKGLCHAAAEFLVKLQSPAQNYHFQFFLFCVAGQHNRSTATSRT